MSSIEQLRRLRIEYLDGENGPYNEAQFAEFENYLQRGLDPVHRALLTEIGGTYGFEFGAEVGELDLELRVLLGLGRDDFNIKDWIVGYRGQIPRRWYPFGIDQDGNLYVLAEDGGVHHVNLEEKLWVRDERPETCGTRIADSFKEFLEMLRLPDWVE